MGPSYWSWDFPRWVEKVFEFADPPLQFPNFCFDIHGAIIHFQAKKQGRVNAELRTIRLAQDGTRRDDAPSPEQPFQPAPAAVLFFRQRLDSRFK